MLIEVGWEYLFIIDWMSMGSIKINSKNIATDLSIFIIICVLISSLAIIINKSELFPNPIRANAIS